MYATLVLLTIKFYTNYLRPMKHIWILSVAIILSRENASYHHETSIFHHNSGYR